MQSECNGQVGPTLSFKWVKSPPDGTCVLPANVTVSECSLAYPWSALFVILLVAVAPVPVVLLLTVVVVMAFKDISKDRRRSSKFRDTCLNVMPFRSELVCYVQEWKFLMLAYLLLWLGVAAHAVAVPVLFADAESGEVTEDTCVGRSAVVVVASALVLLGVTVRVGEVMAAEESRYYHLEKWTCLRLAFTAVAFLNFLAVIASLVAVLGFTESSPVMVNRSETAVLLVAENLQELELRVTRCRSATDTELSSLQFLLVYVPWGVMHLLGLAVHSFRITHSRHLIVVRGHLSLYPTLLTLLLHSLNSLIMMMHTAPEVQTFAIRAPIAVFLGWFTLFTEVGLPAYNQYVRKTADEKLYVVPKVGKGGDTGGEEVRTPGKRPSTSSKIATGLAQLRPISPMKVAVSPMRIMPPNSPRPLTPRQALSSNDAQVVEFEG